MSDNKEDPTQKTDQNYSIDISRVYNDWMVKIDKFRSGANLNLSQTIDQMLGSSAKTNDASGLLTSVKPEALPQESRCHAFYRMIGFPVVDSNYNIYNPGFDIVKCATRTIDIDRKLQIARDPIKDFDKLSQNREQLSQDNLKTFSVPKSIDAGTLALSSGGTHGEDGAIELRKFSSSYDKSSDPFDMNVKNQQYKVQTMGLIGTNRIDLGNYKDGNGNKLSDDAKNKLTIRSHIIKPFIVDARIELSVMPQERLVAIPFVSEDLQLKVSSTKNVERPLIEKYIRDKQPVNDPINDAGTNINSVISYIKQTPGITDNNLIKAIQDPSGIYKQNDQVRFTDTINIMRTLMAELVAAENQIVSAQNSYYWLPEPNVSGPEFGSSVQLFFPNSSQQALQSTIAGLQLTTDLDTEIIDSNNRAAKDRADINTANLTGSGTVTSQAPIVYAMNDSFLPDTTSGLGDNNVVDMETSIDVRKRVLSAANKSLQTIEMIMGEFSGLGLCDIVVIVGALRILPLKYLYGLLDDDAYIRMLNALSITNPGGAPLSASYSESMTVLTDSIKDFYNLLESIYKETKKHPNN